MSEVILCFLEGCGIRWWWGWVLTARGAKRMTGRGEALPWGRAMSRSGRVEALGASAAESCVRIYGFWVWGVGCRV